MSCERLSTNKVSAAGKLSRSFCATLLVCACAPSAGTAAKLGFYGPSAIVPGVLIGHIRLGADVSKETAALGRPTTSDAAMGHSINVWRASTGNEVDVASAMVGDRSKRVVRGVRVTSEYFKTRGGIGVGSMLAEVERAFPRASAVRHAPRAAYVGGVALLDDRAHGIAFEFPIAAGRIGNSALCDAVTIHAPGRSVLTSNPPIYQATSLGALSTTD